jgi:hypothetical protein
MPGYEPQLRHTLMGGDSVVVCLVLVVFSGFFQVRFQGFCAMRSRCCRLDWRSWWQASEPLLCAEIPAGTAEG